jgi:hypothetical protein
MDYQNLGITMLSRMCIAQNRCFFSSVASASLVLAVVIAFTATNNIVVGQEADPSNRPRTQELLPETTVAFIQIDDFRDMVGKLQETSFGKMTQDEAIAPLIDGLWDEARLAYSEVESEVGITLEDIRSLPSGEMTFAIIAPRRQSPEYMLIIELDTESGAGERILERGREVIATETGEPISTEESEDGIEYETFNAAGKNFKFFEKDGLMVGCSSEEELDAFVDRWMEREVEKVRPLTSNRKFVTIMNRCLGNNELEPEARFFIDPIGLTRSATRGNFAAQAAINFLPIIGLDGLLGVGGSMLLSEDDFESVVHGHILLSNPRKGILEMLALKPTDYQPEPWLPADTATYLTTSWDVDKMLVELSKMVDLYQGDEGLVDTWIEGNINERIKMDLKEDVLAHLSGRVTYAEWISPPLALNSQVQIFAMELSDADAFEKSFESIIQNVIGGNNDDEEDGGGNDENEEERGELMETADYKGFKTWTLSQSRMDNQRDRRNQRRQERRQAQNPDRDIIDIDVDPEAEEMRMEMRPKPAMAIVGNYLLMSFSPRSMDFIRYAIETHEGEESSMANDENFVAIQRKMTRLLRNDMPCAMTYQNPEHAFKMLFELAGSEQTQSFISGQIEDNPVLAGIQSRFAENPLPDFDEMKGYFQPTGGFVVSDDTGYHFLAFSMKSENEK